MKLLHSDGCFCLQTCLQVAVKHLFRQCMLHDLFTNMLRECVCGNVRFCFPHCVLGCRCLSTYILHSFLYAKSKTNFKSVNQWSKSCQLSIFEGWIKWLGTCKTCHFENFPAKQYDSEETGSLSGWNLSALTFFWLRKWVSSFTAQCERNWRWKTTQIVGSTS